MSKNNILKSLFFGLILCSTSLAQAQMPTIPIDKDVRIGKLSNGLTYYIRKNTKQPHLADFYIAQKVGSILEEPRQRGLAHFLEHMAFNGTQNFPGDDKGKGIVAWCETAGIKFGVNLNAYTSIDQTVYNISDAPLTRAGVLDSCLLILHDWSHSLLLSDKEIDKERGVIHEEWRSRRSAMQRMQEEVAPIMYAGTKYADCMPIGSMDIVDHFPYKDLRDYYKKWYRPDLQGIIVVGDVDVDQVEAKIKKEFGEIPAVTNPAERIYYPVNNNTDPIIAIAKDKEQSNTIGLYFIKQDATPDSMKTSLSYMINQYAINMICNMLNSRLDELTQKANPPFVGAGTDYSSFFVSKTKDAFMGQVVCKNDSVELGIAALIDEISRIKQHGFTASEYARAKANYLKGLETSYNNREKVDNQNYINAYVNNFLDNEPIPGIEYEYQMMNKIVPNISVDLINKGAKELLVDNNQVLALFSPDKADIKCPTKEELSNILKTEEKKTLDAYVDKVSTEPLIKNEPTPGKIIAKKSNAKYGTTEFTLNNGVKVLIKKTNFKADEVNMTALSRGGNSLFPNKDAINFKYLTDVVTLGGIGNFSATDLTKQLAGKNVSVAPYVSTTLEGVSGSCSPKDFVTMMQLTYLYFTSPRMDQDAYTSFINRTKAELKNRSLNPISTYSDSIRNILYGDNPRTNPTHESDIDKLDYQHIMDMYKDRFKDASDFTFVFVGNIDPDTIAPMIEKYLGSLPNLKRKENFKDPKTDIRPVNEKHIFFKKQETPSALVSVVYNGKEEYSEKSNVLMSMLQQALTMVYTDKIREDQGGAYGVYVGGNVDKYPRPEATVQIQFRTDPEKYDKLAKIVYNQIDTITVKGPSADDLAKIKEYMIKQYKANQIENSYWMGLIHEYLYTGLEENNYESIVNNVTINDIKKYATEFFKNSHRIEVTMTTKEK